jgi:predicted GNAT family acetyltransferase
MRAASCISGAGRCTVGYSIDAVWRPGNDGGVDVRLHDDLNEFMVLTRPLLEADPVRHSIALTVLGLLMRVPEASDGPPVLLTVGRGDELTGVLVGTPPREVIVSGLPADCAGEVAEVLARTHPRLPGAVGPRHETEMFAKSWSECTGAVTQERLAQRAFTLHRLTPPTGVPGAARRADSRDIELLARWRTDFANEAAGGLRGHHSARQQAANSLAAGNAALLWEIDAQPMAWASATAPVAGMSRIGPVYTLPPHRGHGYGSAVTAAATTWSLETGAKHVVLHTDLSNPISNAIYPRIGFRPVYDAVEVGFTPVDRSLHADC